MARPTKYNAEVAAQICRDIATTVPLQVAATRAGIGERTLYDWIKKFSQFSQDIKKAYAEAEIRLISIISAAAGHEPPATEGQDAKAAIGEVLARPVRRPKAQWTAAAWLLERHPKFRSRWAKPKETVSIPTTSVTSPIRSPATPPKK